MNLEDSKSVDDLTNEIRALPSQVVHNRSAGVEQMPVEHPNHPQIARAFRHTDDRFWGDSQGAKPAKPSFHWRQLGEALRAVPDQ